MGLWKLHSNNKKDEIDVKQLIKRLQTIASQQNAEIMQLALQSMLEELNENYRRS